MTPAISEAQRSALYAVRRRGEATVDGLAASLGISASGARQHLASLHGLGLVEESRATRPRGERGRPPQVWHTTRAADALFPKAYGELTNELLGYLDDDTVTTVFIRRRDGRIGNADRRLARCRSFDAKVTELARILDEDGYLATAERLDRQTWMIAEHNCAISAVASTQPLACSSELEFLQAALPDATVERTSHMVAGAPRCAYRITRL